MLKHLVKAVTPPILYEAAHRWKRAAPAPAGEYEFVPEGWAAASHCPGWNAQSILDHSQEQWPEFVRSLTGTQPQLLPVIYGPLAGHNVVACFSYALALAAHQKPQMSMLDWGGGIGHYYLRSRVALPDVPIDYHCKDVPLLASYGRSLFPEATFYSDHSCFDRTYDFVLASTSLHYSEDWERILARLAHSTEGWLLLNRLPCHDGAASYVYRQRALGSEFLSWSLNAEEVLACAADAGVELFREFLISETPQPILNAPHLSRMRAYLFHKRHESI